MSIPHRCPVCEGRGEVGKKLAQINSILISQKPLRFKCHGCSGTGIVWHMIYTFGPWEVINTKIGPDGTPVIPMGPNITWTTARMDLPPCTYCGQTVFGPPGSDCQNLLGHLQANNG